MNTEQHQAAAELWTKLIGLSQKPAYRQLHVFNTIIRIIRHYHQHHHHRLMKSWHTMPNHRLVK